LSVLSSQLRPAAWRPGPRAAATKKDRKENGRKEDGENRRRFRFPDSSSFLSFKVPAKKTTCCGFAVPRLEGLPSWVLILPWRSSRLCERTVLGCGRRPGRARPGRRADPGRGARFLGGRQEDAGARRLTGGDCFVAALLAMTQRAAVGHCARGGPSAAIYRYRLGPCETEG